MRYTGMTYLPSYRSSKHTICDILFLEPKQISIKIMPQFNPLWWINTLSWMFVIVTFGLWFHQSISFPSVLRTKLSRAVMLFYF